ncbi:MAG: glycoside hydrolase family 125 protein [Chitinophagaceae bacterium]
MKRRQFIKTSSIGLGGFAFLQSNFGQLFHHPENVFISKCPPLNKRTFISEAVEKQIATIKQVIKDKEIAWLFDNCYPNTLDTTVDFEIIDGKPDTFIITGDIDAMWLRDSTAQVWPYMPLLKEEKKLQNMVAGLINRQVKCVLLDPYANAFYKDLQKVSDWNEDIPRPIPGVHERKWEIDSLCYVIRLSYQYYQLTKETAVFDADWDKAMRLIVKTFRTEQGKTEKSAYQFIRKTSNMIDAPVFNGTGYPTKYTGLISSAFRPSDDATMYPQLIPSNIFAAKSLNQLAYIYKYVIKDNRFAQTCSEFAAEINTAIQAYAVQPHLHFGKIYAYEVDGFGNKVFMDDANVPSLLSLPYLDSRFTNDPIYQNTRTFLLSENNPYYLKGKAADGQASPHTGKERIWPMGIILRAMTSTSPKEIKHCLQLLKTTHANTGFMHEAFHKDNPNDFTRSWFAWANTLFGELIVKIYHEHKAILAETN